jgi:integrase
MREVTAREVQHSGKLRWRVIIPRSMNSGIMGRRYFTGKGAEKRAKAYAARLEAMRTKPGVRFLSRPHEWQVTGMHTLEIFGDRWREGPKAATAHMGIVALLSVPVTQAVAECMAEKARGNLSPRYMRGFSSTIERFALGKEKTSIDEITPNQVEDFVNRLKASASRRSQLRDLRTLFSFALRRGYVRANIANLVAMPQRDEMEPGILTAEQVEAVLRQTQAKNPEILCYVALVLFAGLRPEEARLFDGSMLKPDRKHIEVPAKISKTNRRRLVEVNETFLAWHDAGAKSKTGPWQDWETRKVREFVRPWPHDALRHSFVSYHSALYGEVATSTAAGHSISVMHRHYKAAVTRADAERFWAMRPNL